MVTAPGSHRPDRAFVDPLLERGVPHAHPLCGLAHGKERCHTSRIILNGFVDSARIAGNRCRRLLLGVFLDVGVRERHELRVLETDGFRLSLRPIHGPSVLKYTLDHPHRAYTVSRAAMDEHGLVAPVGNGTQEVRDDLGIRRRSVERQMDVP